MICHRMSSRRRAAYVPKPISSRWAAEISKEEDRERPIWRGAYPNQTVEEAALMSLRLWVLKGCEGCRTQTAEILGVSVRSLLTYIQRYEAMGVKIPPPPKDKYRVHLQEIFWCRLIEKIENFTGE